MYWPHSFYLTLSRSIKCKKNQTKTWPISIPLVNNTYLKVIYIWATFLPSHWFGLAQSTEKGLPNVLFFIINFEISFQLNVYVDFKLYDLLNTNTPSDTDIVYGSLWMRFDCNGFWKGFSYKWKIKLYGMFTYKGHLLYHCKSTVFDSIK